jgi:D-glycero-alpha-D-manno-heptose 1-phosphate guanylyltransferase
VDVLVLAGGFGTRLRSVVGSLPKPLADIRGIPFIIRLLKSFEKFNIDRMYISLHYESGLIKQEINKHSFSFRIIFIEDLEPLGTGGAIKNALNYISSSEILVVNGDTYSPVDLNKFYAEGQSVAADVLIAGVRVDNTLRFGSIEICPDSYQVVHFTEKGISGEGIINGGIYYLRSGLFNDIEEDIFSFEERVLACGDFNVFCIPNNCDFIDIGIPADYLKACDEAF